MTSTSVTTIGGVVVVTQVIPQDENNIQLQTAAPAPKAPPAAPPTKMDDMTATFLQGEPMALGVVQISVSVLCVLFSLTAALSPVLMVHAPLCLAVTLVVPGALAMAAARRTSVGLVLASLVTNMIGSVLGLVGAAYVSWLLMSRPSKRFCDDKTAAEFVPAAPQWADCTRKLWILDVGVLGSLGILLVLLILQVCVSITICVFSGKAMRHRQGFTPLRVDSDDVSALLNDDGEETPTSPPNSP